MKQEPKWLDPFSPEALREAAASILTGTNYRIFYESVTRNKLISVYRELAVLARKHPRNDAKWKAEIRNMVEEGTPEQNALRFWLIGLTMKTAQNLKIGAGDYSKIFDDLMSDIEEVPDFNNRDMALLVWCGSATLTIRGSQKSKIGKSLERVLAAASLTCIGLNKEKGDFTLNIRADAEVDRETDAEIRTPRGVTRMEVGLIGEGNTEVISDKMGRIERNHILLMDILPKKSGAHQTAEKRGVKLIQMRNGHPVEELRQHLVSLNIENVQKTPIEKSDVADRIMKMPLALFQHTS